MTSFAKSYAHEVIYEGPLFVVGHETRSSASVFAALKHSDSRVSVSL